MRRAPERAERPARDLLLRHDASEKAVPDDAARAVDHGADGILVSNHGARNLDTVPATIDALPHIAARVSGRVPLLLDGGIRRGTDVIKALALGAKAVLIGRPYAYALAANGADGVTLFSPSSARSWRPPWPSSAARIADLDGRVLWTL